MPKNVEIKARLRDRQSVEEIVRTLTDSPPELILQEDIFFRCDDGRLKLRVLGENKGELIHYHRADQSGPRVSSYSIALTDTPQQLLEILSNTLGQAGKVKKRRTLYLIGQTRVHLDEVDELGTFLELEVVLKPGQSEAEGEAIAQDLLTKLKIGSEDLIARPYVELLQDVP